MLILTALIWGSAFVAQSIGMDYVGPFTFTAVRNIIGGSVLLPCIALINRGKNTAAQPARPRDRKLIAGGISCGIALFIASSLQQIGISMTSVGKAGFITALYIVIVPLLGLFLRKKISPAVWAGVVFATIGMYLLCITESFSIGTGDLLVFLCALFFSIHILIIDHYSPLVDCVKMSCIQFFVCGAISLVPMLVFERPQLSAILSAWAPLLYAGVLSNGVAYTFQVLAQKDTSPVVASLILSLESVFSALAGWVILDQSLTPRELAGCALVFCAIILAQLPDMLASVRQKSCVS